MSRSYKHTPRCGERKGRYGKNRANRAVRRADLTADRRHGAYRKRYERYNICDFEDVGTSFLRWWDRWRGYVPGPADRAAAYREYEKWYLRK